MPSVDSTAVVQRSAHRNSLAIPRYRHAQATAVARRLAVQVRAQLFPYVCVGCVLKHPHVTRTRTTPGIRLSTDSHAPATARQRQRPPAQVSSCLAHYVSAQLHPRRSGTLVVVHAYSAGVYTTSVAQVRAHSHTTAIVRQGYHQAALVSCRLTIDVAAHLSPGRAPRHIGEHSRVAGIAPPSIIQIRANCHMPTIARQRHGNAALIAGGFSVQVASQLGPVAGAREVLEHTHMSGAGPSAVVMIAPHGHAVSIIRQRHRAPTQIHTELSVNIGAHLLPVTGNRRVLEDAHMTGIGTCTVIPVRSNRHSTTVTRKRQRRPTSVSSGFAVDVGALLAPHARAGIVLIDPHQARLAGKGAAQWRPHRQVAPVS
jgi:hypothetical protein